MRYLYYRLWKDFSGIVKDNSPAWLALMWLSLVIGINIYTIQKILEHYFKFNFFDIIESESELILSGALFFTIILTLNYFILYKERKKIAEKYKNESKLKSRIGILVLYLYMIGSFYIIYFVGTRFPHQ